MTVVNPVGDGKHWERSGSRSGGGGSWTESSCGLSESGAPEVSHRQLSTRSVAPREVTIDYDLYRNQSLERQRELLLGNV